MSLCIGIDLGTTYSCVYGYDINTNEIYVCKNSLNENTTPSYIKINGDKIVIGKKAKENINNQTYYNMKRFIGKKYNECTNDLKFCSFGYKDVNGDLKIEFNFKEKDKKQDETIELNDKVQDKVQFINTNQINEIKKINDKVQDKIQLINNNQINEIKEINDKVQNKVQDKVQNNEIKEINDKVLFINIDIKQDKNQDVNQIDEINDIKNSFNQNTNLSNQPNKIEPNINKIINQSNLLNPQDISSIFLRELKRESEEHLNYPIKNCVITVPAYFNNTQRELTKQAGIDAGLNVLQIINEPCAAAFAYQLNNKQSGRIMIFDFGGGTLDISILDVSDEGLIVINTTGDNHLGGEDIDNLLLKKCLSEFINQEIKKDKYQDANQMKQEITNICKNQDLIQRLRKECEKSKITLSKEFGFNVNVKNFYNHKDLNVHLEYSEVDKLLNDILKRCFNYIDKSLIINKQNIVKSLSDIVLIGGSTKLEILKDRLREWINKNNKNIVLHDEINPDESVAYGACLHCKNLIKNSEDKILLDVVSHSLGVETKNGKFEVIIPKNTIKPCKFKKIFSTATENQREFYLKIYEGEEEYVKNNLLIKSIKYDNLPAAKPGDIKFEIEFIIDENNIFNYNIKMI